MSDFFCPRIWTIFHIFPLSVSNFWQFFLKFSPFLTEFWLFCFSHISTFLSELPLLSLNSEFLFSYFHFLSQNFNCFFNCISASFFLRILSPTTLEFCFFSHISTFCLRILTVFLQFSHSFPKNFDCISLYFHFFPKHCNNLPHISTSFHRILFFFI